MTKKLSHVDKEADAFRWRWNEELGGYVAKPDSEPQRKVELTTQKTHHAKKKQTTEPGKDSPDDPKKHLRGRKSSFSARRGHERAALVPKSTQELLQEFDEWLEPHADKAIQTFAKNYVGTNFDHHQFSKFAKR